MANELIDSDVLYQLKLGNGSENIDSIAFLILEKAESFFSQPLTPEMFWCGEKPKYGDFLKETKIKGSSNFDSVLKEYQQARQKLVFEGFDNYLDKRENDVIFYNGTIEIRFRNSICEILFGKGSYLFIETLSDLLHEVEKYNRDKEDKIELTLTDSVTNQLKS